MKNLTWQNPEQLFVAQELINKVKSKCCGIKVYNTYLKSVTFGTGVLSIGNNAFSYSSGKGSSPVKTIWMTNTPPTRYYNAAGAVNYVPNDQYTSFSNKTVYPFLSSLFEVGGVKYVPVSPSERTCDAIDCLYGDEAANVEIGETVTYRGIQLSVLNLKPYTCYQNTHVKNVELSLNSNVGDYAFQGCTSLTTAVLGGGITDIGKYSFEGCSKLEGIIIPDAVNSIGAYSFQNCACMASAIIGTAVQTIDQYAFSGCSSIQEIRIPQSVTKISDYVFNGCSGLTKVFVADRETILALGSNGSSPMFSSCPLDSVYIGGNISYETDSGKGNSPFYRNTSLRAVMITDQEEEISPNEFYGCTNLKNVYIGDGVTTIGDRAFSGCGSLDHFAFGTSVTNIGQEAFSDCVLVTKIISKAKTPPTCGTNALNDISKWECILSIPEGCLASYQAADQWKEFFFVEEFEVVIPGDANYDKVVNFADALAIVNYILYGEAYSDKFFANRADMNDDGEITISDAVAILNMILNGQSNEDDPSTGQDDPSSNSDILGTVMSDVTMQWTTGYSQARKVHVNKNSVLALLGLDENELIESELKIVPLNLDGTEGYNGTNGVFGGWFDGDGNPVQYTQGHVYIEIFDDLWNWNCGLYKENCWDDEHTITMQMQYQHNGTLLKVNIEVHFTITDPGGDGGWWW